MLLARSGSEVSDYSRLGGHVVLVVEDDRDLREAIVEALRGHGYEPRCAVDGADALLLIAQSRPSLTITDLHVPMIDGWELINKLNGGSIGNSIPTIAISPTSRTARVPRGVPVFVKPIDLEALLRAVATHLGPPV